MARPPFEDLADIRLHLGVEAKGSVRLAAQTVGISQPAASRRLHALERRAGAVLYELGPRGARLTAAGRFWATEAGAVLAALESAADRFAAEFRSPGGRLRIAAGHIVADYLLPQWLLGWTGPESGRWCDVGVGNSTEVCRSVLAATVELGLVELAADPPRGLDAIALMPDELILVAAPSHRLARRRKALAPAELAAIPLVHREPESGTQMIISAALDLAGHSMAPAALEVGSASAVKAAAAQGVGLAVLPALSVREELETGRLVAVPVAGLDLRVRVHAVYRKDRRLSALASDLVSHLRRSAPDDGPA